MNLSDTPHLDASDDRRLALFTVTFCPETEEWIAKAFDEDGNRWPECDYFTDDEDDCRSTSQFELGRSDRRHKLPCRSANGSYLDGWYSIDKTSR